MKQQEPVPGQRLRSGWLRPPVKVTAGDVLHTCGPCVYLAPFGIISLGVWGLWVVALCAPVIGWINKRELMQEQMAGWGSATWAAIVCVPLAFACTQWLLSRWLRRRRIEVFADRVVVRGVLRNTEVPIQGVVQVLQHYDKHSLSSSLKLHYHAATRVRTISGWLFSAKDMAALGAYIVERNRVLGATIEDRIQ